MFGNSSTSKSLCRFRVTQAHRKVTVHYFKCERCHFLFSPSFWSFTLSDYRRFVYNEDYVFADPHFKGERPRRDAVALQRILAKSDKSVRILDYGSGIGGLAHRMREQGLTNCDSFDPIYGVGPTPSGKFDSISCFEVIEHVKEQKGFAEMAKGLLKANGPLILSTQIQPVGLQAGTKPWWYIEPRNGHLSIHSKDSLNLLFRNEDLRVSEVCRDLFFVHADRNLPEPLLDHSFQREICADRNPLPPCQISL